MSLPPEGEIPWGNPAGFMADAIRRGLSANETLAELRDAGLGVNRQAGLRLYGQVRANLGQLGDITNLDTSLVPDTSRFTPWDALRSGQKAAQVEVFVRYKGTDYIEPRAFTFLYTGELSPDELIGGAVADFADETDPGGAYEDQTVMGWQLIALNAAPSDLP